MRAATLEYDIGFGPKVLLSVLIGQLLCSRPLPLFRFPFPHSFKVNARTGPLQRFFFIGTSGVEDKKPSIVRSYFLNSTTAG
jgi:hypothetical protein